MSKIKARLSLIRIFFSLFILAVVAVFYFIGHTPITKAVQDPVCSATKYACDVGTVAGEGYDSGTHCWTWTCTSGYSIPCNKCTGCGNEQIDAGEDCDGGQLGGQTCQTLGYDGGVLSCFPSCFFNESGCTYNKVCGNNVLDSGERCDMVKGSPAYDPAQDQNGDGVVDCKDFGFNAGTLGCTSKCLPDTSNCSHCNNNGVKEPGEECDGFDFGFPAPTCQTYNCTGGNLTCNQCKISKELCTGCAGTGCTSSTFSDWSKPGDINKTCCGAANNTIVSDLSETSGDLCPGSRKVVNFQAIGRDGQPLTLPSKGSELASWTWTCGAGSETCKAYKQAECAGDVSSSGYSCNPDTIFDSYDEYFKALCLRAGTADSKGKLWQDECARVGVAPGTAGTDEDYSPLCAGGLQSDDKDLCTAADKTYNKFWYCLGEVPPGKDPALNKAHCEVGWAPPSTCGTVDKKVYTTGKGLCSADSQWNEFFGLTNKGDRPELCGAGSTLYLPNTTKKYWMAPNGSDQPTETSDYSGFDNLWPKYFSWKCYYNVAGNPRKGKPVDCQAKLYPTNCSGGDAVCGPATGKKFAAPGFGPQTGFCKIGKLGGSIGDKVHYNKDTHTWTWTCLPQDSKDKSADCSVTATVFCGPAGESNQEYSTEDAVRSAGPCAGVNGELFPVDNPSEQIKDRGTNWEWTCVDSGDSTVFADCKASNGKCGHAGGRVLLQSTFDSQSSNDGFLCARGVTATGLETRPNKDHPDNPYQVQSWAWQCGNISCAAVKLSCGYANGHKYFKDSFDSESGLSTFLCSKPRGVSGLSYSDNIQDGGSNSQATWSWSCLGDDGDTVSGCSANRYACGWANNHKVDKFYDPAWPDAGNNSWTASGPNSEYCTYDAVKGDLQINTTGTRASWTCKDPNSPTLKETCTTDFATCGSATNYKDYYSSNPQKYYYKSTLDSEANAKDNFLCINGTPVSIQDNGSVLNWSCRDDFNTSRGKFDGSGGICEVKKINCGTGNGATYTNNTQWDACVWPFNSTNKCLCNNRNNAAVDQYGNATPTMYPPGEQPQDANWYCSDDKGASGTSGEPGKNCQATCTNCN